MIQAKATVSILLLLVLHNAGAQPSFASLASDTGTATANPKFQASGLHRFLFGSLWRDAWTTPVQEEILNLDSQSAYLAFDTILAQMHQGNIIRSLQFKDKNGTKYIFTSLYLDSVSSLPPELTILLPKDIVRDQISTLNPYAPIITSPILQAVGLPYRETRVVILPGEKHFAGYSVRSDGELGMLEGPWRFPSGDTPPCSDELVSTTEMLESLESDIHNRIDELQYLKARLIDILLGNWDRPADQWRWFKGKPKIWEPIPLGHQQAFVRLNGLLPTIADLALPQLEHCGESISNIENLTLTGRVLDRRLLLSFPKQTWDSLASWIQTQITDSVIMSAITHLPIPIREREGESILNILRARRVRLQQAAHEFYELSSAYVVIYASNNADRAEIRKIGRHMVSMTLYDRNDTGQTPAYRRLFYSDFTKEIRLLLLGGDDSAVVEGEENSTIKIIIDGGEGKNELSDISKSHTLLASMSLFSSSGTFFYDDNPASIIKASGSTAVLRNCPTKWSNEKKLNREAQSRDWGSEWSFSPWLDINPDDGLFIGGGPIYTQYGYRNEPYVQQIEIRAGLATRTGRYRLDAAGNFRDWFRGIYSYFQLHASQLDLSNFFGLGNETRYSQALEKTGTYKVDQQLIFLHGSLNFSVINNFSMAVGTTLKLIDNNPQPGSWLSTLKLPYYNKSLTLLFFSSHIHTDTRDDERLPTQGLYSKAEISFFPRIIDNSREFFKCRCEIRAYMTPESIPFTTVAMRATGEKIWGSHPFSESAFLGGNESLRGFERQRFAGDASFMGSIELRTRLAQIPFLVPLWTGFSIFSETGRVFLEGEQSNLWHNILGGGVWFSVIKSEYLANFSLARSEDKFAFYATLGFMF